MVSSIAPASPIRMVRVESAFDPESHLLCCGRPARQKLITYDVEVNDQIFRVPDVWASVCDYCTQVYFAPEVGSEISERIFQTQHQVEARIAELTGE